MTKGTTISTINYEQPLDEVTRVFMRYEHLADRFAVFTRRVKPYDTHVALLTLVEIFNLVSRRDIKQDLLRQLKQQIDALELLTHKPKVSRVKLNNILTKHKTAYDELHEVHSQINNHLNNNDFFNSIRQRTAIPGGTCDFDIPEYHHWLGQPHVQRKQVLMDWMEPFRAVENGISQSLRLIRQSVSFSQQTATKGFYRQVLNLGHPCQMIRISVDCTYFPECSAGKQRFSIRFMTQPILDERPRQTDSDIKFKLACCGF